MAYWVYVVATTLCPMLPEEFGYRLFSLMGDLAYVFGGHARANYINNLKHVLGPQAPDRELRRTARQAFRNSLKNYFDLFRGHRLSEAQLRAQLEEVVGFEYFQQALALGKGMITGSAHFGNFNLILHLAAVYLKGQCRIIVPNERLSPPALFELVRRQRAAQGIEIVPVDTAVRPLIKALRGGNIVGLALDLDTTNTGVVVELCGSPARLPDGAVALALKFQAPLVIGFTRRLDDNRCKVVIEPPVNLDVTGDLAENTRRGVQKLATRMEEWIKRYPEQWLMFQPIWEDQD